MFSRFEGWESNQTVCLQNFSSLLLGRSDENRAGVETDGIWGVAYTRFLVADVVPYISRHLVSSHGPGAQWRRGPGMGSLPSRSLQLAGGRAHARNRSRRQCDKTRLRIKGTDSPRGRGRTPFKVRYHSLCPFPWETFLCVGSHLAPLLKGTNVAKMPFRGKSLSCGNRKE